MSSIEKKFNGPMVFLSTKYLSTYIYLLSFILIGMCYGALGPSLPAFVEKLQKNIGALGIFFSVKAIGGMIGSLFVARLFDHLNSHKIMGFFVLLLGICVISIPFTSSYIFLIIIFFLCGILEITIDVGGNVLVLWQHKKKSPPYMSALHVCFGIGAFISPLFVAFSLKNQNSILPAYLIIAAPMVLFVPFMMLRAPEEEKKQKNEEKGKTDLKTILIFCAFFFIYVGLEGGFGGFLPSYSIKMGYLDKVSGSYLASLFFLTLTLGRVLTIPLSAVIKLKNLLIINSIAAIFFVLILLLPTGAAGLWISAAGLGLSISGMFPGIFSTAERKMHVSGKVSGFFTGGASFGAIIIPWSLGKLLQFNLTGLYVWIFLFLTIAVLLIIIGIRKIPDLGHEK